MIPHVFASTVFVQSMSPLITSTVTSYAGMSAGAIENPNPARFSAANSWNVFVIEALRVRSRRYLFGSLRAREARPHRRHERVDVFVLLAGSHLVTRGRIADEPWITDRLKECTRNVIGLGRRRGILRKRRVVAGLRGAELGSGGARDEQLDLHP